MSSNSPIVKNLKASFEARANPAAPSPPPKSTNANMPNKKIIDLAKPTIDSVLDQAKSTVNKTVKLPAKDDTQTPAKPNTAPTTPSAGPLDPPPLAASRRSSYSPSWIGPKPTRPETPGVAAMKQPVTLEYSAAGLQPPVYVFTSLSDPQWQAVEMDTEKKDNGDFRYFKTFQAEEGEYQYKFRIGSGDWWALDENKPVVDDGAGNKNNLLVVNPRELKQDTPAVQAKPAEQSQAVPPAPTPGPQLPHENARPPTIPLPAAIAQPDPLPTPPAAPLMAHEKTFPPDGTASQQAPAEKLQAPVITPGATTPAAAPLMKHETFEPEQPSTLADSEDADNEDEGEDEGDDNNDDDDDDDDDDGSGNGYENDDFGDGEEYDESQMASPLLRHESLAPDSAEQTQAPLMRHESFGIGDHGEDDHYRHHRYTAPMSPTLSMMSRHSSEDVIPQEADPNDPSLEKFPTDHRSILDHIHRASTSLPEDQTRHDYDVRSIGSAAVSNGESPVRSLESVEEGDEQPEEDQEAQRPQHGKKDDDYDEEIDPNSDAPAAEDEVPVLVVVDPPSQVRPEAPITPPLTPKEAEEAEEAAILAEMVREEGAAAVQQEIEEEIREEILDESKRRQQGDMVVMQVTQQKGVAGTVMEFLTSPISW
jgi:hypothetical protein